MKIFKLSVLVAATAFMASGVAAKGLLDKISKGAGKVAGFVEGTVGKIGETVDSTIDLVTGEATPEETRDKLDAMAGANLDRLFSKNEDARILFDASAGYAVFDTRKITLGVAAGFGRGVAVSRETAERTYMNMGTGGVGWSFGLGGFETQVVILFETTEGFKAFITNGYDATAEAGSMLGDETVEETVRFVDGRSIFVLSKKGWKVSASAAGTKYWVDADLN